MFAITSCELSIVSTSGVEPLLSVLRTDAQTLKQRRLEYPLAELNCSLYIENVLAFPIAEKGIVSVQMILVRFRKQFLEY